jgi:hydrogenase maturation protease
MKNRVLVIGYGNAYCRDDGVGLYVINALRRHFGDRALQADEDGLDELGREWDTVMLHQLVPEIALTVKDYGKVVFVDAHMGTLPDEVRIVSVREEYAFHAVTHHMSPGMILATARKTHGVAPQGFLVSVKGDDFQFGLGLSETTQVRADKAVRKILELVESRSTAGGETGPCK